nr:MAG TPA: hypothetical protein [Caudoviricetes sp.]
MHFAYLIYITSRAIKFLGANFWSEFNTTS